MKKTSILGYLCVMAALFCSGCGSAPAECGSAGSHSYMNAAGTCLCEAGYRWKNPDVVGDFHCVAEQQLPSGDQDQSAWGDDDTPGGDDDMTGDAVAAGDEDVPEGMIVDLRADVNRNGVVELDAAAEDQQEHTWDAQHGAILLANIDDDQQVCPSSGYDALLPLCNDGYDEEVNGEDDLLDMAPLKVKPWPAAPDGVSAQLSVAPAAAAARTHIFIKRTQGWQLIVPGTAVLSAEELRSGVDLAVEATDIVRDRSIWDGFVDVTLTVSTAQGTAADTVRFRVAPLITRHHLDAPHTLYAAAIDDPGSTAMRTDLQAAMTAAGIQNSLVTFDVDDQWTQDYFETAYMSMPSPTGMHVLHVNIRSANVYEAHQSEHLRPAGQVVYALRGKDVGAIQEYERYHDEEMDTLDSFGNLETVPPYTHNGQSYPLGRIIRGSAPDFYPDPNMTRLLEAQMVQPPIYVDTSWLLVAHIDETVSFVKADTPRGWAMAVNDARLAKRMLEQQQQAGKGATLMFSGKNWFDEDYIYEVPAAVSIDQVLNDPDIMAASQIAAVEVDAQVATIKQHTGLTDAELIPLPFLHQEVYGYSVAYQVGTVNGISLGDGHYGAPKPHGPVIDGVDIFEQQLEQIFAPYNIAVHFIEEWDLYHRLDGEVHCASNTRRVVPQTVKWWESGR